MTMLKQHRRIWLVQMGLLFSEFQSKEADTRRVVQKTWPT